MLRPKLYIIGVDETGRKGLRRYALRALDGAEIVFGGERLFSLIGEVKGERFILKNNLEEATAIMRRNLGKIRMVVLASGDPNFFGIARYIIKRVGKEDVEIVPNLSSMQLAFARIKEPWDDAGFVSIHGRPMDEVFKKLMRYKKLVVLIGEGRDPSRLGKLLLDKGINDMEIYVCQRLGSKNEMIKKVDVDGLSRIGEVDPITVLVLIQKELPKRSFGVQDFFVANGGNFTKLEVRAISIAKMELTEESVVWDVGAGYGTVSLDAAFVAREGKVYAVEKEKVKVEVLKKNVRAFKAWNVEVVEGEAPDALEGLPSPDVVFIGGSGGRIRDILEFSCEKLKPGGRIVMNLVTLEGLEEAIRAVKSFGMEWDVTAVSISRSHRISQKTMLKALNPVFVVSGRKWLAGSTS